MTRIRCRYIDCIFLETGFCSAEIVKIDPDEGCLTYTRIDEINLAEEEGWEEDELEEIWEDDDDTQEDEKDDWIEDDLI